MGPSVKFVSAIKDSFSNKKMGVNFFHRKKSNGGGGVRGGFGKRPDFFRIFFGNLPLETHGYHYLATPTLVVSVLPVPAGP